MAQVRGEKVKEIIREGLCKLSASVGKDYVYSISELAALTGVSRPTLYRHGEFIDSILKELKAEKKGPKGYIVMEFMRDKLLRLEEENQHLKNEVDVMRKHHVAIFKKLYHSSQSLADLVKPFVKQESTESGRCILCQREVDATTFQSESRKVVHISSPRGKKK